MVRIYGVPVLRRGLIAFFLQNHLTQLSTDDNTQVWHKSVESFKTCAKT